MFHVGACVEDNASGFVVGDIGESETTSCDGIFGVVYY